MYLAPNTFHSPLAVLPRWPILLISAALIVLGWVVLAASIMSATPIGLVTPQAISGLVLALIGLFVLTRATPLQRWRAYGVLSIVVVAIAAAPPALTIQALITISLWAAFELGILLTRFQLRVRHA